MELANPIQENQGTYILMARKSKNNHREAAESRDSTSPMNNTNRSPAVLRVPNDKVINNQNHQVGHRNQSRDAGILERVQPP